MTSFQSAPARILSEASPWWQPDPNHLLSIEGGRPLAGRYPISGAKNAVLPLMVSALLTPHLVTLQNVPRSLDVAVLGALLHRLGVGVSWSDGDPRAPLSLTLCADRVHPGEIEAGLVMRMRASILLLGALLARCGEARMPMPGGDSIGLRTVDFHLAGLRAMGAEITLEHGIIDARAPDGLHGAEIQLEFPSVGATQNLLLAAVLANGTSILGNVAREPEVVDLCTCLIAMGARIEGIGSSTLAIEGRHALGGVLHRVMPDRIELGTIACAAAATGGEILLEGGTLGLLGAAAPLLEQAGVGLREVPGGLVALRAAGGLVGIDVVTQPWPGFATDLQAPTMALLCIADGAGTVTETIFESRFRHVDELRRMGAAITVRGRTALVRGVPALDGASVMATDVRAGAALVIAGLTARGTTLIDGLDHIDRGYDGLAHKLAACGARLKRCTG